ncbi:MAG: MlaD family protein [Acidobacteriota bacterium]
MSSRPSSSRPRSPARRGGSAPGSTSSGASPPAGVANVGEIEEGAPVMMAGYQVGEVRAIAVLPKPMLHFEPLIRAGTTLPIEHAVASFGLTGGRYLDLRLPLEIAEEA